MNFLLGLERCLFLATGKHWVQKQGCKQWWHSGTVWYSSPCQHFLVFLYTVSSASIVLTHCGKQGGATVVDYSTLSYLIRVCFRSRCKNFEAEKFHTLFSPIASMQIIWKMPIAAQGSSECLFVQKIQDILSSSGRNSLLIHYTVFHMRTLQGTGSKKW